MRTKRILSLLLAITVTATMIMALPLTASAAEVDSKVITEGYTLPFTSTNPNYVDWLFHQSSIEEAKLNTDYRTFGGSATDLGTKPEINCSKVGNYSYSSALPEFDLPHNHHDHHADKGRVLKIDNSSDNYFTITNALPDTSTFNSYDLIVVYNYDGNKRNETLTVSDSTETGNETYSTSYTDTLDGNGRTDIPDEVIFKNLTYKDLKLTFSDKADLFSVSIDYHKSADAPTDVTLSTTKNDYVSGYYTKNDAAAVPDTEKLGVIRFFQSYENDAAVDGYGFVFLNAEGEIISTNFSSGRIVKSNSDLSIGQGFYGDVYNIASDQFDSNVIAVPYVSVDGYTVFSNTSIVGKVDGEKWVQHEDEWVLPAE